MGMDMLIREGSENGDADPSKNVSVWHGNAYSTWEQTAGYFDGDGTVSISITRFGFAIGLAFVDNYKPLLEHIAAFLQLRGFYSTLFLQKTKGKSFWRLRVRRNEDTVGILSSMLPHLDKKQDEPRPR